MNRRNVFLAGHARFHNRCLGQASFPYHEDILDTKVSGNDQPNQISLFRVIQ